MIQPDLFDLAVSLTRSAGLPPPATIERMAGGRNNRVFRVVLDDGSAVALKSYHFDERDPRDRLGAEWSYLSYVWDRDVRNVPQPLASMPASHAGLYGFVRGRRPDSVGANLILQAADFVASTNRTPRRLEALPQGSEACFSIADHLSKISDRVQRLSLLDETAPSIDDARHFVLTGLEPAWHRVSESIRNAARARGILLDTAVETQCVSPSDFGFHNALIDEDGTAAFIDFEYAGRDDPAKLVCDFFCQPEVPVSTAHYRVFVDRVAEALALSDDDRWRCDVLLDAYRIKWVCIILNEFLPMDAARRAFAEAGDRQHRAARQLQSARHQLSLLRS